MFKESIMNMQAYHPQKEACPIVLDANESYFNKPYNKYPDPTAKILRKKLGDKDGVSADEIIAGNGSSELIDLIMKTTLSSNDIMLTFGPTFSIYALNARIIGGQTVTVPLEEDFTLNVEKFIKRMKEVEPKLIVLCNPNNPTGTILAEGLIVQILEATSALVVVDEAYIDFGGVSMVDKINDYPNLVVLKTLSKAYGMAGVRLGYMLANEKIIQVVNKVRPPYNLSSVAQEIGVSILDKHEEMKAVISDVLNERERVSKALKTYVDIFPSGGNFIFFKTNRENLYQDLVERGIRIRKYSDDLEGYYRVTIGRKEENQGMLNAMEAIYA